MAWIRGNTNYFGLVANSIAISTANISSKTVAYCYPNCLHAVKDNWILKLISIMYSLGQPG